jgi:hypothetical protein
MKSIVFAMLLLMLPAAVLADAPQGAGEVVSPPDCRKPPVITKIRKADDDSDFESRADSYKTCINDYVAAQSDLAKKHTEAANAAINQYNDFVKLVNDKKGSN